MVNCLGTTYISITHQLIYSWNYATKYKTNLFRRLKKIYLKWSLGIYQVFKQKILRKTKINVFF